MARVSDEEIERLKKEVSLERLVQARGIELKRNGEALFGRCPFHDDAEADSLSVSPRQNTWKCLGRCRTGGSVIDWVMKAEGVSFRHAVELLRADAPIDIREWAGHSVKQSTVRKLPSPINPEADDKVLLRQVVDYYHQSLKESPEAFEYLEARGLRLWEMLEKFKVGFSNRTLGLRLPMKNRATGDAIRSRLIKLGILRDSGHEHFNGSVTFPVFGDDGEVLGLYGRKITSGLRAGTPLHTGCQARPEASGTSPPSLRVRASPSSSASPLSTR